MKGLWIPKLASRLFDGSISPREAFSFVMWRVYRFNRPMYIEGVVFDDVDRILWGLIAEIFIKREYTPKGFEIMADDIVVDLGAHRGVFTAFAAKRTRQGVLAVEPDKENVHKLNNLIEKNDLKRIRVMECAVAASAGVMKLYLSQGSSRHSLTGIDQKTGENLDNYNSVNAITLSEALSDLEKVDYLKIDCEGAEHDIIASTDVNTLHKVGRLVMEVHGEEIEKNYERIHEKLGRVFDHVLFRRISNRTGLIYAKR